MGGDAGTGEGWVDSKWKSVLDPGSAIEKKVFGKELIRGKGRDPLSVFGDPAVRAQVKEQDEKLARQKQKEKLKLAESENEIATRKALARSGGGRSLLTATSPTGVSTLGGA